MTFLAVLCSLRARLIMALAEDNREELLMLFNSFTLLKEATYNSHNKQLTLILADMEAAAQDGIIGVNGKHAIAPEE